VVAAERLGFDSLWFSDLPMLPSTDPFLAVSFAAATSTKVKLGVNLVPFGYRPFVFARQVAALDRLTGGRLLVTLVPGLDRPGERDALGTTGRHRGRILEELIPNLRVWWAGGEVGPAGNGALRLPVTPSQSPLEVWLGGSTQAAVRRAGRFADGWLGSLVNPSRAGAIREEIQREAAAAERSVDPEHFGLSVGYARRREDLNRMNPLRRPIEGPLADVVPVGRNGLRDLIAQLTHEGLSKFVVRPVAPPGNWEGELEWLAGTILDLQT
jgi:alkanesulfonate monooxygenase SsuD/methylene tetrahydromethanopterin reductase-like flavin-dependent oxidoreductase (luciferase family)